MCQELLGATNKKNQCLHQSLHIPVGDTQNVNPVTNKTWYFLSMKRTFNENIQCRQMRLAYISLAVLLPSWKAIWQRAPRALNGELWALNSTYPCDLNVFSKSI